MGAPPKADWREERRKRAWVLKQNGWPQKQIAAALGVSEGAVSQWLKRARDGGGVEALRRRPPPGTTPRLSEEQRAQLPTLLGRGAPAYGFSGDGWTADRVAVVIERTFGVHYHRDSVSRILSVGSCQSDPARLWVEPPAAHHAGHAARRGQDHGVDPRAVACAQKRADDEGATIVWVDESGFSLLPLAVRTWAPRGQTPVLRVPLTRDHLAAISAITLEGRLFLQVRKASYDGEAVVGFLRVLLRKMSGKILLIWDGSPIHHGQAVKDFLRAGAAKRLHLEQLPGYAPDLNPDEGLWNYLKRVALGTVCATTLADLRHRLRRAAVRVRHKPDVIRACSRQCGYLL